MPKITLLNGDTGKLEEFEPVDAREILSQEGTIYSVPEETKDTIGLDIGPGGKDINVPQLQGADAEMNTGLSIEKYGREAVVKAEPGNPSLAGSVAASAEANNFDEMTVAEMREYAETHNIDLGDAHLKADILKKIKAKA